LLLCFAFAQPHVSERRVAEAQSHRSCPWRCAWDNASSGFERIDDREDYGEERINLLGMCQGVILHVTYTERGERIRIISARLATRNEQDDYYRENAR
jgi:uncharacterized DUF497 family protein